MHVTEQVSNTYTPHLNLLILCLKGACYSYYISMGRSWAPVPKSPYYGLCGRQATFQEKELVLLMQFLAERVSQAGYLPHGPIIPTGNVYLSTHKRSQVEQNVRRRLSGRMGRSKHFSRDVRRHTGRKRVKTRPKLQVLVYDILPSTWRKVPEGDARSVH